MRSRAKLYSVQLFSESTVSLEVVKSEYIDSKEH